MSTPPVEIVQRQVEAYNAHDLDGFISCYHPDATYMWHPDNIVLFSGRNAMREAYGKLFEKHPAVRATIANRIALGRFVIDLEQITGRSDVAELHVVAIYEVADQLIQKVWVIRS